MKTKICRLAGCVVLFIAFCCLSCGEKAGDGQTQETDEAPAYTAADTLHWNTFVTHLRENFDDLHDVTMRYHHKDHTINGTVTLRMTWENSRLKSADVVGNETGSDDLPASLIEKMEGWEIQDLTGTAEITVPINVKLVGLDDPDFPSTAILTGEVRDARGDPVHGAMIMIRPQVAGAVFRAETNREGIFVRTLIPPGTWDLECSHQGYETASKEGVDLAAGRHTRESFVLKPK